MKVYQSILILALLSLKLTFLWAVNPATHISQYAHTSWRVQDGIFSGAPNGIAQTSDGYVWVGTENGLFRYDGAAFVPFAPPNQEKQPLSKILSLYAARDGSLWIGSVGKLMRWKDGQLTTITGWTGWANSIAEDHNGKIWFAATKTPNQKPLCEVSDTKAFCHGRADGYPSTSAGVVAADAAGSIWAASADTLVHWQSIPTSLYEFKGLKSNQSLSGITTISSVPDGSLYVGAEIAGPGLGLQQIKNGITKPLKVPGFDGSTLQVATSLVDHAGSIWIGTLAQGLYRVHGNQVEHYGSKDGLSGDSVASVVEDHEGNIWVATSKGVDCFRDLKVLSWSTSEGLSADSVRSVVAGHDGTIWVGTGNALDVIREGRVAAIGERQGLPGSRVTSMLEDRSGRLWLGVDDELAIYTHGTFKLLRRPDGTTIGATIALAEDTDGDIWASVISHGYELLRIKEFQVAEVVTTQKIPPAVSIAADPQSGIWLSVGLGRLGLYRNGHFQIVTTVDKAPTIFTLVVTQDGSVLGSTLTGVMGWRNGKLQMLDAENGLPCNGAASLAFTDRHSLVLAASCGLIEINENELQKWWKNPKARIAYRLFDRIDGARISPTQFRPRVSKAPDGKIWFANESELQMFDPSHVPENRIIPPVDIEEVIADRKTYKASSEVTLPPLTRNLEIRYTALSFVAPQKVRFRYRLEGYDRDWQEPGPRREAFYENLAPGHYRFRVIASNNDGIWNETGATQDLSIEPIWYQTNWFQILAIACVLLLLWTAYRLRVRYIATAIAARFDERLAERTRMARELHDTFLQTVQGSKMVADDALDEDSNEIRMRHALEKLSLWLGQAVTEGRAALHALRTSTTERNHLAESLRQAAEDHIELMPLSLAMTVIGDARDLHPIVRDEINRIGDEAIRNACTHSHGSQLEIELIYGVDLTLSIKDNGVGIDPAVVSDGRDGHFGLQGMRERAARISGKLSISSNTKVGTTVTLLVPGNLVYRKDEITFYEKYKRFFRKFTKSAFKGDRKNARNDRR